MVNRLLRENRKSIPMFLTVKKLKKKCNPPDFKSYLDKLNNKENPHMVQCYFCVVFNCINNTKISKKINITPYGENSISSANLMG